ncbi:hypothetical protein [Sphingosinicella soli]|uniref:Uncharacterized protein n=1 Tax=Sphingosinicella soli TaxID=333708 RepID=A0A7W7B3Y0_9SPHN|nr:hypothetical protein [Sphingosinicella soli]MBB4633564.1 hypothetical protein [Sphingosinicella soli]
MQNPVRRFRVLLLSAFVTGAAATPLALWYLSSQGVALTLHLVLALSLAIILSLLLAAGLMGLVFFSAASGHDQRVADENAAHEPVWRDSPED